MLSILASRLEHHAQQCVGHHRTDTPNVERAQLGIEAMLVFTAHHQQAEAIAIGMISAALIGEQAGVTPPEVTQELQATLKALSLPTALPDDISDETLLALTTRDKKAVAGEARFVLAERLGLVALMTVQLAAVRAGLQKHRQGLD